MVRRAFELKYVPLQAPFLIHWWVNYVCGGNPEVIDYGDGKMEYRYVCRRVSRISATAPRGLNYTRIQRCGLRNAVAFVMPECVCPPDSAEKELDFLRQLPRVLGGKEFGIPAAYQIIMKPARIRGQDCSTVDATTKRPTRLQYLLIRFRRAPAERSVKLNENAR